MKEQIKKEMSNAIGSYSNSLTDSIAERCTEIALKYIEQSHQAHVGGSVSECKVCGKPFGDKLSLYEHYDEEHNKQTDL